MSKSAEYAAEVLQATLAGISTKDLVDELSNREGVSQYTVKESEVYQIQKSDADKNDMCDLERYYGPIQILTVIEQ